MALVAMVATGACKSDNKVGNKALLDFKEQANNRLGETTTTTAAATTTTAKAATPTTSAKSGAASTTTTTRAVAAVASTTTAPAKAAQSIREIAIYGDDAPQPLDPQTQTAYVGSIIRWTNKDTVERSVRADGGQFASPMIKPGASWDYTVGTVGIFAYGDDTRPYVHGELRVSKP
jgi:plastocyanin